MIYLFLQNNESYFSYMNNEYFRNFVRLVTLQAQYDFSTFTKRFAGILQHFSGHLWIFLYLDLLMNRNPRDPNAHTCRLVWDHVYVLE